MLILEYMKKGMLLAVTMCFVGLLNAQVRDDKMLIQSAEQPALRLETDHDAKMVTTALMKRLKDSNIKTSSSKGIITATGVKMIEITPDLMDYYFKVEPIDKKRSVLLLSISKGYTNFVDQSVNGQIWDNAKAYLLSYNETFRKHRHMLDAEAMKKEVSSLEKAYDKTVKDFKKQEDALAKARKTMEDAQKSLSEKKAVLESLQIQAK